MLERVRLWKERKTGNLERADKGRESGMEKERKL